MDGGVGGGRGGGRPARGAAGAQRAQSPPTPARMCPLFTHNHTRVPHTLPPTPILTRPPARPPAPAPTHTCRPTHPRPQAYNAAFAHFDVVCPGDAGPLVWSEAFYDQLQNTVGGGKPKMKCVVGVLVCVCEGGGGAVCDQLQTTVGGGTSPRCGARARVAGAPSSPPHTHPHPPTHPPTPTPTSPPLPPTPTRAQVVLQPQRMANLLGAGGRRARQRRGARPAGGRAPGLED